MDFPAFIQKLKEQLSKPLPGEPAQFKMAPTRRLTIKEYYELGNRDPKRSAVLVCLYPFQNAVYTALMLRPTEQGIHSDQVSFPGGKFEEGDETLQQTALREAKEELNIYSDEMQLLGALTPVYIPVSNYMVQPFVAATHIRPPFQKSDLEVKEIIETDVAIFLKDDIKGVAHFPSVNNLKIEAPYYEIQGHRTWGATAMILSELTEILKIIDHTL